MSTAAKDIAAEIRRNIKTLDLPGVEKVSVRVRTASMMTAIDVTLLTTEPARVMVMDPEYGETWPYTTPVAASIQMAKNAGLFAGAYDWQDGRNRFFDVEARQG